MIGKLFDCIKHQVAIHQRLKTQIISVRLCALVELLACTVFCFMTELVWVVWESSVTVLANERVILLMFVLMLFQLHLAFVDLQADLVVGHVSVFWRNYVLTDPVFLLHYYLAFSGFVMDDRDMLPTSAVGWKWSRTFLALEWLEPHMTVLMLEQCSLRLQGKAADLQLAINRINVDNKCALVVLILLPLLFLLLVLFMPHFMLEPGVFCVECQGTVFAL